MCYHYFIINYNKTTKTIDIKKIKTNRYLDLQKVPLNNERIDRYIVTTISRRHYRNYCSENNAFSYRELDFVRHQINVKGI